MPDQGGLRLLRILPGVDADADLGPRVGHDGVDRPVDGQRVEPGDRRRRARPHALAEVAGAEERQAGAELGELAELVLAVRGAVPRLAVQARDGDVAVGVVQATRGRG